IARPSATLSILDDTHPSALAMDTAITIDAPRARSSFWVIIARRQRTHSSKTANAQGRDGGLGTPSDHNVCITVLNQTSRITNRMQTRCARRYYRIAGAF